MKYLLYFYITLLIGCGGGEEPKTPDVPTPTLQCQVTPEQCK